MVVILMGVSGAGKTAVGVQLAGVLGWAFVDADSLHPPENVAKMARGVPLTDRDRAPWLAALRALIEDTLARGESAVLACSALKARYRAVLGSGQGGVHIVYLKGSRELIHKRLEARAGHYMKAGLLESQFSALERPADALVVNVDRPLREVVACILGGLHLTAAVKETQETQETL